jgi:hypothetical protein
MKYTIEVDHKLKIIKYKHSGIIQSEEIGYVWENEFLKMKEFTELKYNLFSDYTDAVLDIPVDFLDELMSFMQSIQFIIEGKKQSVIVSDPYSTAASILFENEVNEKVGFHVKVFTTTDAALKWLII